MNFVGTFIPSLYLTTLSYLLIFEASNEASLPLSDFSLVRAAFPNIIENLNKDYGRGIYHMLHAILQYNTDAFQKF
jgi:hypothetical protein